VEVFTPGILIENRARSGSRMESRNFTSSHIYLKSSASYDTRVSMLNLGLTVGGEIDMRNSTGNSITLGGLPNGVLGPIGQDASISSGYVTLSRTNDTVPIIFAPSFGIASQLGADKDIFTTSIRPELNSSYCSNM